MTVLIAVIIAVLLPIAIVGVVLLETSISVDPGTIALLLKRGRATGRALPPGRHFIVPWRKVMVQTYPSRELALVVGGGTVGDPRVEYLDEPLPVHLGDRAVAHVSYTVRCQLDITKLRDVHDQYGPEGLWPVLRDASRSTVLTALRAVDISASDAYGDGFTALERRLGEALGDALGAIGFELKGFTLRGIDLGETDDVIQAIVRADAELEREQAVAKVRRARLENDAAMASLLDGVDGDTLLRYRQIEAWRDLLQRWDGDQAIPSALTVPLLNTSAAPSTVDATHAAADEAAESTDTQQ